MTVTLNSLAFSKVVHPIWWWRCCKCNISSVARLVKVGYTRLSCSVQDLHVNLQWWQGFVLCWHFSFTWQAKLPSLSWTMSWSLVVCKKCLTWKFDILSSVSLSLPPSFLCICTVDMEGEGSPAALRWALFSIANCHIQIWRHRHLLAAVINMDELDFI